MKVAKSRERRAKNNERLTVSFVIPVFNEVKRLHKTFEAIETLKLPRELKLKEIVFVDDGSTDPTSIAIELFAKSHKFPFKIKLLTYKENKGKGHAVRLGMQYAKSDYALFFDADMSTPLSEMQKILPAMQSNVAVVIGTRKNGKSTVVKHQPIFREILGRGFTKLTQTVLGVSVTDFTCGFKAFSRSARKSIFTHSRINGWGYDAEIIFLADRLGFSYKEVPVIWSNDDRTKVKLYKAVPQSLIDLATIFFVHKASYFPLLLPRTLTLFLEQRYSR